MEHLAACCVCPRSHQNVTPHRAVFGVAAFRLSLGRDCFLTSARHFFLFLPDILSNFITVWGYFLAGRGQVSKLFATTWEKCSLLRPSKSGRQLNSNATQRGISKLLWLRLDVTFLRLFINIIYCTHIRFTRGQYYFYTFSTVGISLKFSLLLWCCVV